MAKETEWVKVQNPNKGLAVMLCKYRKVRGNDKLDVARQLLLGKVGKIVEAIPDQKDESGCILVWVWVNGNMITWRLASLKKEAR